MYDSHLTMMIWFLTHYSGCLSLEFLVMSDWGGESHPPYYNSAQTATATTMGKIALEHDIQFVLALGDNFYNQGVKNIYDERFQQV